MSAKHTPGPWHVGPMIDGEIDDIPEIVIQRAIATGNLSVAVALGGLGKQSQQEANAHLIAAAPELLEALEKIIEMNRVTAHDQFGDSEQAERWACVIVARAAIAKATWEKS